MTFREWIWEIANARVILTLAIEIPCYYTEMYDMLSRVQDSILSFWNLHHRK